MSKADSIARVLAFGTAWDRCDIEGVLSSMAPNVVYQNIPLPAMVGHDAVRAFITPNMTAAERMDWQFLAIEADDVGTRVLTERIDSFIFKQGRVDCPVMGIFELEGGLIVRWRDYTDISTFVENIKKIGGSTPVENAP